MAPVQPQGIIAHFLHFRGIPISQAERLGCGGANISPNARHINVPAKKYKAFCKKSKHLHRCSGKALYTLFLSSTEDVSISHFRCFIIDKQGTLYQKPPPSIGRDTWTSLKTTFTHVQTSFRREGGI